MKLPTVCALDCPDACMLEITVEDGAATKVEGQRGHEVTQGFACVKMARYPERQNHRDRLLYPQRRIGKKGEGRFTRISWDEALDEFASRIRQISDANGPESILPYCYAGTMGIMESAHTLALFRAIGASELDHTICASTAGTAWEMNYGPAKLGPDPKDAVHARCIVLWGINLLRSNSHFVPFLKEARKRGAKILHIDPYRNETSRFADEHWQINVGTDAALALAIGNEILSANLEDPEYLASFADGIEDYRMACAEWPAERAAEFCGIPADKIRKLAHEYASSESSFIKVGYGMTRNEGGGNAMRAVTLLPALIGAWKQPGGGATLSTSGAFPLNRSKCGAKHLVQPNRRHVNMNLLASELEPASGISALVVFNSNPAAVAPESVRVRQGLSRDDLFTVVLEHFQTDTADYADLLLPATTFLEHPDIYTSYGHLFLQWSEPIVAPRGECKPNSWIFSQVGKRLGISEPTLDWTVEQLAESLLDTDHPWLDGITVEKLKSQRSIKLAVPEPFRPYANGSNFPDRKIRFSPAPQQVNFQEMPNSEYPFRLISPPGAFIINTSMGNLESIRKLAGGQPQIIIHPKNATELGIAHESIVRITSRQGTIDRQCLVSDETLYGVVIALGQWWPKLAPDKKSLNDLTSERLTDIGGGSTFGNTTVRIEALVCQPESVGMQA